MNCIVDVVAKTCCFFSSSISNIYFCQYDTSSKAHMLHADTMQKPALENRFRS